MRHDRQDQRRGPGGQTTWGRLRGRLTTTQLVMLGLGQVVILLGALGLMTLIVVPGKQNLLERCEDVVAGETSADVYRALGGARAFRSSCQAGIEPCRTFSPGALRTKSYRCDPDGCTMLFRLDTAVCRVQMAHEQDLAIGAHLSIEFDTLEPL